MQYNHREGKGQRAQLHLFAARAALQDLLPPLGYRVGASGVNAINIPRVPWLAVYDPDVTTVATRGQYLVYLFDADIDWVYLSMNQGATAHRQHYVDQGMAPSTAERAALLEITAETKALRERLGPELLDGTVPNISLGTTGYLPAGYEAGNVAALQYDLHDLPSEDVLLTDLHRFLGLYEETVKARHALIAENPDVFHVGAPPPQTPPPSPEFKPKDSSEYTAWVESHRQTRSRKHECLVNNFAAYAGERGWAAGTKGYHPRDLVLERDGQHLLIEAKTVGSNSEMAVREAIGQLFTYEYVYYSSPTQKVALFSAPVGSLWLDLLARLGIDVVWSDGTSWHSSGGSVAWV